MQHVVTASRIKTEKPRAVQPKQRLLSLYTEPPQEELTMDEFELYSLDRLQLLRSMEILKTRCDGREFNEKLEQLEKRYLHSSSEGSVRSRAQGQSGQGRNGTIVSTSGPGALQWHQRKDEVSHFILRLAYSRSEDLRRWFLTQECQLLKSRLERLQQQGEEGGLMRFMQQNGIMDFQPVSQEEKMLRQTELVGLAGISAGASFLNAQFYKIPFAQALSLVSSRAVYLEAGFALVPLQKLVSIIVTKFRMGLSRSMVEAANHFDIVSHDTRIGPLLKNMNKQFIGQDFSGSKSQPLDKLTPEKIDAAADAHMPLCMKNLHANLRREHKLKHWGRLQYGLFLKGAGLDLEGAMQFWESHFQRIMNHDQFQKSYAYSFRHMYGKEGSRKNYTPYSCMKIIMGTPPEPGAFHGCPYRHSTDSQLGALLSGMKLGSADVREIGTLAKTGNYQLACQKHFDVTHPGHLNMDLQISDSVANHPNQWFKASSNYHKLKSGGSLDDAASPTSLSAPTGAPVEFIKPEGKAPGDESGSRLLGVGENNTATVSPFQG